MRLRSRWIALMLLAVIAGAAGYWYWLRRQPRPAPPPAIEAGLAWLPAEAGLVASLHFAEIRKQAWLLGLLAQASQVEQETEYQQFVAATGFDYARDLDQVWVAVLGGSERSRLVGVAQGRFAKQKILSYARQQPYTTRLHRDIPIHVVTVKVSDEAQARQFAFAFLDELHVVFGDSGDGVVAVLDCQAGKTPAVLSDPARKAHIERFAAGMQAWAMNDLARWLPPPLAKQPELAAQLQQLAVAARVTSVGVELVGEAQTRAPGQAATLGELLRSYALLGRVALGGREDAASQALARVLEELELEAKDTLLSAKVRVSAETLKSLLSVPSLVVGQSAAR